MEKDIAVGIDLGTTYSCVGVYRNGRVEIIANQQGSRTTPSCVAFTATERLVGENATDQAAMNAENTIFSIKRLIGRKYDDESVQSDMKVWPFKVENIGGTPMIKVQDRGVTRCFAPEELSAMVLTKLKVVAEKYLGFPVKNAVITVPAYFNDSQRQATKDAGTIAGLNVLKILNEPTAAAIAYGMDKKVTVKRNILVFDLGGGTFDTTVVCIERGEFDVKAVGGDTHLGGDDIDNRLLDYFIKEFQRKNKKDMSGDKRACRRLRNSCEKVKRMLSSVQSAKVEIDCLFEGIDFHSSLSRALFENLNSDLFHRTMNTVGDVLADAGMTKEQIQEVVLAGGSTRIPKIQEQLANIFTAKKLNFTINPDEAVCYGAAVQAAMLSGENSVQDIFLLDVVPLSLGIKIRENLDGSDMSTIIKRNTKIPTKKTLSDYSTSIQNQDNIHVQVYEGERRMVKYNNLLGEFVLRGIQRAPARVPKFAITFDIDADGILQVSAVDQHTRREESVTIASSKGRLSKEQIEGMVAEAQKSHVDQCCQHERVEAKNDLENYCFRTLADIEKRLQKTPSTGYTPHKLIDACNETILWVNDGDMVAKEEVYKQKMGELEKMFTEMADKFAKRKSWGYFGKYI